MKSLNDYIIEDFTKERLEYFDKILSRTKCVCINKELKQYLLDVFKLCVSSYYCNKLVDKILENNKPIQRVELVLVDKIIE